MSGYRCFVCPVEYNNDTNSFTVDCEPSDLFRLQEYNIPGVVQSIVGWVCATYILGGCREGFPPEMLASPPPRTLSSGSGSG